MCIACGYTDTFSGHTFGCNSEPYVIFPTGIGHNDNLPTPPAIYNRTPGILNVSVLKPASNNFLCFLEVAMLVYYSSQ